MMRRARVTGSLVILTVLKVAACQVEEELPEPVPAVVVGNVALRRDTRDPQRYALTMDILNQSEYVLREIVFHAQALALIGPTRNETLTAPFHARAPVTVGGGIRVPVEIILETPFTVVPPVPLILEDIRIGEFLFAVSARAEETFPEAGWVVYPWPVEESS